MSDLAAGLRDTAKWIRSRDPIATNYLFCLQAADAIERLREALIHAERILSGELDGESVDNLGLEHIREALAQGGAEGLM